MRLDHRAGCDSGVDYTTVVVFTIWIAMTIVLVVLAVLRSNAV
jgi:preprotein translocase subunit SecG